MKRIIILLLCSMIVGICYSQELFIPDSRTRSSNDIQKISNYLNSVYCEDYFCGAINIDAFLAEKLYVTIPNKDLRIEYNLRERGVDKWIGDAENGDMLIAIIDGMKAIASVTINDEVYQICSLDESLSVLAKLDQSYFAEESSCATSKISTTSFIPHGISDGVDVGPMRILVAYTPTSARYSYPDIISRTKLAIEETNRSYNNSRVGIKAELAACIAVNYQEVQSTHGYEDDLNRFSGKDDGYMDEIHTLRNLYTADICVLIEDIYQPGLAGIAATIYANESKAFCVVDYEAMVGYYSFAHEIGHLQGARHDINMDPSLSPFSYAHGYLNPFNRWRTIMGYGNYCNSCQRVLFWSNPNVLHPRDLISMGSSDRENNARVLNETYSYVTGFRTVPDELVLPNIDIKAAEYVNLISMNTIKNTGNVSISSGAEVNMKSPNSIKLLPGFSAKEGCKLTITNGSPYSVFFNANMAQERDNSSMYKVTNENINYSNKNLNLEKYGLINKVEIFNLEGIKVISQMPLSKEVGLHDLNSGTYIVKLYTADGNVLIEKIFIK